MVPATSYRMLSRGAKAVWPSADKCTCLWASVAPRKFSLSSGGTWNSLPSKKVAQRHGSKPVDLCKFWDRGGPWQNLWEKESEGATW